MEVNLNLSADISLIAGQYQVARATYHPLLVAAQLLSEALEGN